MLWNIYVWIKQQQPGVAMWLHSVWWDFCRLLYYKFTAESVCFQRLFGIAQHLAKFCRKVDCLKTRALCTGVLSCWKMNNLLEIWCMAGSNCCNSITLWLILLTNLGCVIGKYQTGVMSTTCYSPTDVISDWKINCVWTRFVTTSFFLVDECAYSRS